MRSRARDALAAAALALALAPALTQEARAQASAPGAGKPTREQVERAAQELRDHPDLAGTRTQRTLKFKDRDEPRPREKPSDPWAMLRWIRDFFGWLAETARWLLWAAGAVVVAVILVKLRAWWRGHGGDGAVAPAAAPTRVRDLDIRPESLPADVGAAALALWREGRVHEALSLLYRGALSRLVHGHGVPIRASSTEGDCLRLAARVLARPAMDYLDVLVIAWQQAVYAGQPPGDEQMAALCATFDARLAPAAAAPSPSASPRAKPA